MVWLEICHLSRFQLQLQFIRNEGNEFGISSLVDNITNICYTDFESRARDFRLHTLCTRYPNDLCFSFLEIRNFRRL